MTLQLAQKDFVLSRRRYYLKNNEIIALKLICLSTKFIIIFAFFPVRENNFMSKIAFSLAKASLPETTDKGSEREIDNNIIRKKGFAQWILVVIS